MKIRIRGNSLRYRLTKSEVERFAGTGFLEERINFGPTVLFYALSTTDAEEMSATFNDNRITLYLPSIVLDKWLKTELIGFEQAMPVGNSTQSLYLLVEKDFTCLDNVTEDQSDNYPNPLLKKSSL